MRLCRLQEKRLISKFFDEISQDSGKHTSGVKVDTAPHRYCILRADVARDTGFRHHLPAWKDDDRSNLTPSLCFHKDTLACLEMGAVDTLIVWESLDIMRLELRNPTSGMAGIPVGRTCDAIE